MAQWIECLLHKCEALSVVLDHMQDNHGYWFTLVISVLQVVTGGSLELSGQSAYELQVPVGDLVSE